MERMIFYFKIFIKFPLIIIELSLISCNLIIDAHKMSDGRAENYKQRKCFIECIEKKALLYPAPDPNKYFEICLPAYALGCPN